LIDIFAIIEDLARRQGVDAARISVIELNRSGPAQTSVVLLAFLAGRPDPIAFIKATPDADRAVALRREFDNLTRLGRGGDEAFRRSVPEPLYCERLGELTVLAESAMPGTRMKDFPPDSYFASRRFRGHFLLAVRWLDELRKSLADDAPPAPPDEAAREVARYRETHRVSPALNDLLDETVGDPQVANVPRVPSHGDFCTANVVIPDGNDLFVIDWEYPLTRTWPLADLLYFTCSTWCVPYRKGRDALKANYRHLFFSSHGFSDLLRESVAWYAGQLGIAADLLLPLSAMCWVAYANRKQAELARGRAASREFDEAGHTPLIIIEDGACLNLEMLAEHRDTYLLAPL
jgi:aminoglycoside phosphotransferase (APT) family kinase protein